LGRLFFRAEGRSSIGLGHLIRSSALADMLKTYFPIVFVINEDAPESIRQSLAADFEIRYTSSDDQFVSMLEKQDGVILDGYHFSSDLQERIKMQAAGLVCIDDMHDKHFYADIIINQALNVSVDDYDAEPYTRFLFGPAYLIVRRAFLEKRSSADNSCHGYKRLLICFGGSDYNDLTGGLLQQLDKLNLSVEVDIVVGTAYRYLDKLKDFKEQARLKINIYQDVSAELMASLISTTDIAVAPGSSILLEILSLGKPAIAGYYTDNQLDIYRSFLQNGLVEDAGDFNDLSKAAKAVERVIKEGCHIDIQKVNSYFDGQSPRRILTEFLKLFFHSHASLDRVTKFDSQMLFEWANDTATRENSINTAPITWEEHSHWFEKKVNSDTSLIYILRFNHEAVGQIRFDIIESFIEISYAIAPGHRGLGLGKLIIAAGVEKIRNEFNTCSRKIRALVRKENIASRVIFLKAGFEEHSPVEIKGIYFDQFQLLL